MKLRHTPPRAVDPESGQMLPLMAVMLTVLLGFAALAVDVGYQRYQNQVQQMATDSAAVAGAATLKYSTASTTIVSAATADATSNGFTSNANLNVQVYYAPNDGPFLGDTSAVEVVMKSTHPTFFEAVLGKLTSSTQTRAVARYQAGPTACIYALNTSGYVTINAATIDAPNCGLIGNGTLTANAANVTLSSIGAYGKITSNATTYTQATPQKTVLATDPCPTVAGCNYLTNNLPKATPCTYNGVTINSANVTINPGVYCGGLTINASTVTMNAGVYAISGTFTSNASTLVGSGVTIVQLTGNTTINSATLKLSAPATGNTAGILLYQPASNTSASTVNATSSIGLEGAIYVPKAVLTTNAGFSAWMLVIAASITLNAGSVTIPVSNLPFPGVDLRAFLVE